jgi:hypothetical protein
MRARPGQKGYNRLANMEAAQKDLRGHKGTFQDHGRKETYQGPHPLPAIEF